MYLEASHDEKALRVARRELASNDAVRALYVSHARTLEKAGRLRRVSPFCRSLCCWTYFCATLFT